MGNKLALPKLAKAALKLTASLSAIASACFAFGQVTLGGPYLSASMSLSIQPEGSGDMITIPGLSTWRTHVTLTGTGWRPNEVVKIYLRGPLNTVGVASTDRGPLNRISQFDPAFRTDAQGNLSGTLIMPFKDNSGSLGHPPDLPRPGLYTLVGIGQDVSPLLEQAGCEPFPLVPDMTTFFSTGGDQNAIDWGYRRGSRSGFLGDTSPELVDPEWISIWSNQPVAIYGTVAETTPVDGINDPPQNQPAFVSHAEWPPTHYGHDVNLELLPDPEYQWVLAAPNFVTDVVPGKANEGRIEFEWEFANNGDPYSYGQGPIGLPAWAMASAGDRIFAVGHWVMDNAHPGSGDRTEIHPGRMVAVMRKRDTAVTFFGTGSLTRAKQVDVYVSGHGGGVNQYYDGFENMLDNNGIGGGNLIDYMPDIVRNDVPPVSETYERFGPASSSDIVNAIVDILSFLNVLPTVYDTAGPSALATDVTTGLPAIWDPSNSNLQRWTVGPENRDVNDMDYDFDVPLPPAPVGMTEGPQVNITTRPGHSTGVHEVITYTHPDPTTGLPTVAHVHLPYKGADSGVFAKTFKFYWDGYNPPGKHYVVTMNKLTVPQIVLPAEISFRQPLRWNVWTDIAGNWNYLPFLNSSAFLPPNIKWGSVIGNLGGASYDVFLDDSDTLRVFTQGYEAHDIDQIFGHDIGKKSYDAGLDVVSALYLGNGENIDLGGSLYNASATDPGLVGEHSVPSSTISYPLPIFVDNVPFLIRLSMNPLVPDFTVSYVPRAPHMVVSNTPLHFGQVCLDSSADLPVHLANDGEQDLFITGLTATGSGFSVDTSILPILVPAGQAFDVPVHFKPTGIAPASGTLKIMSNDPYGPPYTTTMDATVGYPIGGLTGNLLFGILAVSDKAPNHSQDLTFSINNTGTCTLIVNSIAVTSGDVNDFTFLPFFHSQTITIGPGGSLTIPVEFNPTTGGKRTATISVTLGNDPTHSTPLTITATGGPDHP